ncbi:MAG: hypothetical protein RMZ43_019945 [Nostoc sp. CmiVER01]|uniref:hypothetical protein n=1 Tax=Nostoc sp. CmiVER01 TaxID=3075384 RepID=UPI002AD20E95|nr:hypothetical protein [Nostoc sp. CmiVER01]MDZ8125775.1 hypothetical protein [Nostoc sp. CmiVER01]
MRQYLFNLLIVVLGTSSTFIITPSQAETPVKSNTQNTDNITSISSNSPSAIQLSDFANSTNSKPPILSEVANKSSDANVNIADNANITSTKPKLRVPIFSRIFPTASMQQ